MKYILLALLLVGCGETEVIYGDLPFIEMSASTIVLQEQTELCNHEPTSIFCVNSEGVGNGQPDYAYAMGILRTMNDHFSYTNDDYWHYNDDVYKYLKGDCEDIASTMAVHMVNNGIGKEYLYLVYRKTGDYTAHLFLAVDTSDKGLIHLDYDNSGYQIEENINYHLPLTDVTKWIKGNIR